MSENATWERRRQQAEKDARETARPVFGSTVGAVYALRPVFDRILRRAHEDHDRHDFAADADVCGCGRDAYEVAARRVQKKANRAARHRRRFHRPISARKAARAAA